MNPNISRYQFSEDMDSHTGAVEASLGNEHVGHLYWARHDASKWSNGEIMHVYVDPAHQRQGLASHLLNRARELDPNVHHSKTKTRQGSRWAKAVG